MKVIQYKRLVLNFILGLFLISITKSWAQTFPHQLYHKTIGKTDHLRTENIRIYQSLEDTFDSQKLLRQNKLLLFKNNYSNSSFQSDLTLDGSVDKEDVLSFSLFWTQSPSTIPTLEELMWLPVQGEWESLDVISGEALQEAQIVSLQAIPNPFQAEVSISLLEGTSAGFMIWADGSGLTGFVIRYDSFLHSLILSRYGLRLEEERLDTFPLNAVDRNAINLKIEAGEYAIRAFLLNVTSFPILEATDITPMGNHIGWYLYDAKAEFQIHSLQKTFLTKSELFIPDEGEYQLIFDQSMGENQTWYINDHCFVQGLDGQWHVFGTSNTSSPLAPLDEDQFVHATADSFTQNSWMKQPIALFTDTSAGESQLWAPHVIFDNGLFYMFYCAGSQFSSLEYRIHLATSPDLYNWTRHESNPLFMDYYDARDPMILKEEDQYIMYYTANSDRPAGNHIVAYRTSNDLTNWSPRKTAFTHETIGTFGGPTESPFVVKYQDHFYLLIGPESLNTTPDEDYRRTAIYRSPNPFHWDPSDRITSVRSHAAEVIQDMDGSWYVSHGGWFYNGVYVAPLKWEKKPSIQLFVDLGESLNFISNHFFAMISDWRNTEGLDLVADYGSFFDVQLPVNANIDTNIFLEFEEEGETLLRIQTPNGFQTLLNEGNTGPGNVTVHKIEIVADQLLDGNLSLRFSDSDPFDGWGTNVNWIRLLY